MPLASLHLVPELVVNNAQVWSVLHDPLVAWVQPRLDDSLSVPDELANVELVVENAGAAPPVSVDG